MKFVKLPDAALAAWRLGGISALDVMARAGTIASAVFFKCPECDGEGEMFQLNAGDTGHAGMEVCQVCRGRKCIAFFNETQPF